MLNLARFEKLMEEVLVELREIRELLEKQRAAQCNITCKYPKDNTTWTGQRDD